MIVDQSIGLFKKKNNKLVWYVRNLSKIFQMLKAYYTWLPIFFNNRSYKPTKVPQYCHIIITNNGSNEPT